VRTVEYKDATVPADVVPPKAELVVAHAVDLVVGEPQGLVGGEVHPDRVADSGGVDFPWFGGGAVRTVEYKDATVPADVVPPKAELPPHAAE
jgi:hypothetical protein